MEVVWTQNKRNSVDAFTAYILIFYYCVSTNWNRNKNRIPVSLSDLTPFSLRFLLLPFFRSFSSSFLWFVGFCQAGIIYVQLAFDLNVWITNPDILYEKKIFEHKCLPGRRYNWIYFLFSFLFCIVRAAFHNLARKHWQNHILLLRQIEHIHKNNTDGRSKSDHSITPKTKIPDCAQNALEIYAVPVTFKCLEKQAIWNENRSGLRWVLYLALKWKCILMNLNSKPISLCSETWLATETPIKCLLGHSQFIHNFSVIEIYQMSFENTWNQANSRV